MSIILFILFKKKGDLLNNCKRNVNFFLLIIFFKFTLNTEQLFSYGMKYAKTYKLNNGNIIVIGNMGINTYDKNGTQLLYNYTITENKISEYGDGLLTNFAQFSEENNGIVIIMVNHILYILNSNGQFEFKYKLEEDLSKTKFYSIIPYIYKDNYYDFILGYINTKPKAFLQYYLIDLEKKDIITKGDYEFDEDDEYRKEVGYDNGITCEFMNHYLHKIVLTCFYQNNMPSEISSISFKLKNKNIEKIENLNSSFSDMAFCLQSDITLDRKNSLLCYVNNMDLYGYCAVYNIDQNKFGKFDKYISNQCNADINRLSVEYFKETKEHIFSCTKESAQINIVKFDENYDIIEINAQKETSLSITHCYSTFYYSILFISNQYTVIGDFSCDGDTQITALYSISEEYKPKTIYNNISEISLNEDNDEYEENSFLASDSNKEISSNKYLDFIFDSSSISQNISNNQIDSSRIISNNSNNINNYISTLISDYNLSSTLFYEDSSNKELPFKCDGYKDSDGTICSEIIPNGYYIIDILNKLLGKCYKSCQSCEKGPEDNNNNCITCKENFEMKTNNNCLYKFNYYFDNIINETIYLLADQLCPENLPYEIVEIKECVETCTNNELINKQCKINYFSANNINLITSKIKSILKEKLDSDYNVIIDGNNIIYEITSTSINKDYYNVSKIDFGECENILKKYYSINYLLLFKYDIKINDSYPKAVEYEVYSPETREQLNLSLCKNTQIDIYVPINLDNYTKDLYNSMMQGGFDIFNKEDSFYKDICTPFTSDDGTDIILFDRQTTYFKDNYTFCEKNCFYKFYNISNGKVKCQCQVKYEISDYYKIINNKIDINSFLDIKTFSNIELIKCYKLTFSKIGLSNNYGSLILDFNIIIFISLIIIYHFKQKKSISRILRLALKESGNENPPKKKMPKNLLNINGKNDFINHNQKIKRIQTVNRLIETKINEKINKRKSFKNLDCIKKNLNTNLIQKEDFFDKTCKNSKFEDFTLNKKERKKSMMEDISIYGMKRKNVNIIKDKTNMNNKKIKYNDYELNNLLYKEAILIDKRTYFQYYLSLIKTKHIILFIFMPSNDYNLILIKIGLFIFSFCLYFTINALFFTDKTMHKIYEKKGILNIISQLPQIFYSTIISVFINMILKMLALSEKDILVLKKIRNKKKALEKSSEIYSNLIIKFNLFFFIALFLLIFFWYYVSAFCAVYRNTQIILITNTFSSFILSLIYPFALNLLPGIFRFPALKSRQNNKEFLYTIGNIIALII